MKTIALLIMSLVTGGCALAQPEITGAEWSVTLKVVGESGQPIDGAEASVGYMGKPLPGQLIADSRDLSREISGVTDQAGLFTATHTDTSLSLGFDVQMAGYYPAHVAYTLFMPGQFDPDVVNKNRNPSVTIVLKKILNPIPMYAKSVNLGIPVFDKPTGFDLLVGDWVVPYGKGTNSDIIFTAHNDKRSEFDYDYTLVVSFPGRGDGLREFSVPDAEKRSGLRSFHDAPDDGYKPQWIQTRASRPHPGGYSGNRDENRNYYFRTTRPDGVHYGKIYGDFMRFTYYLNPIPNDRNVEFDPRHNLLKLNRYEFKVTSP